MSVSFPYTYYACSCAENTSTGEKRTSQQSLSPQEEDERTFNPRSRRSNFSLYPIEHLLYCTECHEMRCPRCVTEEVICWYCPNCLFEAPSSTIKQEGHRCSRNCFNCPICTSILSVNSLEQHDPSPEDKAANKFGGPYILHCPYCAWSTLDIGITFPRPSNVTGQLAKTLNGGQPRPPRKAASALKRSDGSGLRLDDSTASLSPGDESPVSPLAGAGAGADPWSLFRGPDPDDWYHNLLAFYKQQLSSSDAALLPGGGIGGHGDAGDLGLGSPSSIARLLHMYGSSVRSRAPDAGPRPMREAATADEGLLVHDAAAEAREDAVVARMRRTGWDAKASVAQRREPGHAGARFADALRPISPLLRTKRAKRCGACRQILAKPEGKVTSVRSKIKLLALQNLPKLSVRPLHPTPSAAAPPTTSASTRPLSTHLTPFASPALALPTLPASSPFALTPLTATHYLLTLTNPLYDAIRVHLAAPSTLPGPHGAGSRVTILCPEFEVGANTDVWDGALAGSEPRGRDGAAAGGSVEAGKIWARGMNWTTVAVEVVVGGDVRGFGGAGDAEPVRRVDDALVEVPLFVRVEYETAAVEGEEGDAAAGVAALDLGAERRSRKGERAVGKVKREEAFWTVLGVGRVVGA